MEKFNLEFDSEYWSCGDGCCDGCNTTVTINGEEIGTYGDLSLDNIKGIERFVSILNTNDKNLILTFSADKDADGDIGDVIYLNNIKLVDSLWGCEVYQDILHKLELRYLYQSYDLDWDIWSSEKKFVLVLEEEELK